MEMNKVSNNYVNQRNVDKTLQCFHEKICYFYGNNLSLAPEALLLLPIHKNKRLLCMSRYFSLLLSAQTCEAIKVSLCSPACHKIRITKLLS